MQEYQKIVKIEWVKDKELGDGLKLFDADGNWSTKPLKAILENDTLTWNKNQIEEWLKENFGLIKTKNQFIGNKFFCELIKIK